MELGAPPDTLAVWRWVAAQISIHTSMDAFVVLIQALKMEERHTSKRIRYMENFFK
jgi:hypothetical protein